MNRTTLSSAIITVVIGFSAASSSAQSLLLHYNFNEASNGTTPSLDVSGSAPLAPGTFVNAATRTNATPVPGAINPGALDLTVGGSTTTNYVDSGDVDKIDGLSKLTATFWLNLRADQNNNDRILSDITGTSGWELRFGNAIGSGGSIRSDYFTFIFTANAALGSPTVNAAASNQWMFFALTYDGTLSASNLKFWQAPLDATVTQMGSTVTLNQGALAANASSFFIGKSNLTPADRTPPAWMDDVRIYDGILSQSQLQLVANSIPEPSAAALLSLTGLCLWQNWRSRSRFIRR